MTTPTLKNGKTILDLVPIIQGVMNDETSGYKVLLDTLSSITFATIDVSNNATYQSKIVDPLTTIQTKLIDALKSSFSSNTLLPIDSSSAYGQPNPYFRLLVTTPDGFSMFDTKSSVNDYDHSPFTSANTACQITSLSIPNGGVTLVIPDSHGTRRAWQHVAGQLPNGFVYESKMSKGNKLNIEYRLASNMITDKWFNCGVFSVAFYNVKM